MRQAPARSRRRVNCHPRMPAGPRARRCSARARFCRWAATRTAPPSSTSTDRSPTVTIDAVDVDATSLGQRHRARRRQGSRDRRQRGRESTHGREQQRRDLESCDGPVARRHGWRACAPLSLAALLLPDATVLVAGGGAPGPQVNTNAEIYYPPYLFDASGQLACASANHGWHRARQRSAICCTIEVDDNDISRITLVKTGRVTHSVNMDQRFLELSFVATGNLINAQLPARASDTPPGFYHAVCNRRRRCAVAREDAQHQRRQHAEHGGRLHDDDRRRWRRARSSSLRRRRGARRSARPLCDYVNQVGPQCVRVDQFGRWIGDPVARPVTGTTTTGTRIQQDLPSRRRGQRLPRQLRAIREPYRASVPRAHAERRPDGHRHLPRRDGRHRRHCAGAAKLRHARIPSTRSTAAPAAWLDSFGVLCRPAR